MLHGRILRTYILTYITYIIDKHVIGILLQFVENSFFISCLSVFTLLRNFIWAGNVFHVIGPR